MWWLTTKSAPTLLFRVLQVNAGNGNVNNYAASSNLMQFTGLFVSNGRYGMNFVFPVFMAASEESDSFYSKFRTAIQQLSAYQT